MELTELAEKSMRTLELPAVLSMLAAECVSAAAKENALSLQPSPEKAEVKRRLDETTAAKTMMVVRGSPSFSGVRDVRSSLARADLGGSLSTPGSLWISPECCNAPGLSGAISPTTPWATPA
jgi:DNA mismatch repair protein MutS2